MRIKISIIIIFCLFITACLQKQYQICEDGTIALDCLPTTAVKVEKVKILSDNTKIKVNSNLRLSATVELSNGKKNNVVNWSSSDESIASVNTDGLVTGHKTGLATIKAVSSANSEKFAEVFIEVIAGEAKASPVSIENLKSVNGENTVQLNKTLELTAQVKYSDDTVNNEIAWKSFAPAVATIDEKGVITGMQEGKSIITAAAKANPEIKATMIISVVNNTSTDKLPDDTGLPDDLPDLPAPSAPSSPPPADNNETGFFTRDPYIQLPTENSIIVVFRTGEEIDTANLKYKVQEANCVDISNIEEATDIYENIEINLVDKYKGNYQYETIISGLKSNQCYKYDIYFNSEKLTGPKNHFKTMPRLGQLAPIKFWVVGDTGTDGSKEVFSALHAHAGIDFALHLGDMAYNTGRDSEFQKNYFEVYNNRNNTSDRYALGNMTLWPAIGNHDAGEILGVVERFIKDFGFFNSAYYYAYALPKDGEVGGYPSHTEGYYSFTYGRVHFMSLNSAEITRKNNEEDDCIANLEPDGCMAKWILNDFKYIKDNNLADWVIAYWHHPPYSKGTHDSDAEYDDFRYNNMVRMRESILPILEEQGVDLVITGHSHAYERSRLLDQAYSTPTTLIEKISGQNKCIIVDYGEQLDGYDTYHKQPGIKRHDGTIYAVAGHGGRSVHRTVDDYNPVFELLMSTSTYNLNNSTQTHIKDGYFYCKYNNDPQPDHEFKCTDNPIIKYGSMIIEINGDTLSSFMLGTDGEEMDKFRIIKDRYQSPERKNTCEN